MKKQMILPFMFLLIAALAFMPTIIEAQFEDIFESAGEDFKKMKRDADDEFAQMREAVDEEFGEILDKAWKELELSVGMVRDTTPKPDTLPVARPAETPVKVPPPDKEEEKKPVPKPRVEEKKVELKKPEGEPLSFSFFETPIQLNFDSQIKVSLGGKISESAISSYWKKMSTVNYNSFLLQFPQVIRELGLNDWGYCLLLDKTSEALYGASAVERPLFLWFMLTKSGYDARIGFNQNQAFLLLPSVNTIYSCPFYELDNRKYYIMYLGTSKRQVKSLYTYEGSYKDAGKPIDFNIYQILDISKNIEPKKYTFIYSNIKYDIPIDVNRNVIKFYEDYPSTNLDVYFKASISPDSGESMIKELKPIIQDKPEGEAINILLRFVQNAFPYKTDDEQFGREKYFFPEETLFYPFSDCEDRSILFAYLVTNLLGLDVVGLEFPGHAATAVRFNSDVSGDFIDYRNEKYIICDPTYVNANYGECMPQFKTVVPKIVRIRTD